MPRMNIFKLLYQCSVISYRRGTARRDMSLEILSTAEQLDEKLHLKRFARSLTQGHRQWRSLRGHAMRHFLVVGCNNVYLASLRHIQCTRLPVPWEVIQSRDDSWITSHVRFPLATSFTVEAKHTANALTNNNVTVRWVISPVLQLFLCHHLSPLIVKKTSQFKTLC